MQIEMQMQMQMQLQSQTASLDANPRSSSNQIADPSSIARTATCSRIDSKMQDSRSDVSLKFQMWLTTRV